MAQFVPTYTRSAVDVLVTECARVTAERDAFVAFQKRLREVEPAEFTSETDGDHPSTRLVMAPSEETQLQRVRNAYRETVMSMPHYGTDYNESLIANLAAEFSPAVATAVTTDDGLSPQLRERLLVESQHACDARTDLFTTLTQERERLQTMAETMLSIGSEFDYLIANPLHTVTDENLVEVRKDIRAAERRCDELARERQEALQTTRLPGLRQRDPSLNDYVYRSLSVDHPVLADLAELTDALRNARERIDTVCDTGDDRATSVDTRLL